MTKGSRKSKKEDGAGEEGEFSCSHCGKSFGDLSSLRKHITTHGEKTFVCTYEGCGKRFLDQSKLRRHMLVHTGERPYKCEICGKRFSLDFNLRTHIRIHTGEKPYVCKIDNCNKRFGTQNELVMHEKTHISSSKQQFKMDAKTNIKPSIDINEFISNNNNFRLTIYTYDPTYSGGFNSMALKYLIIKLIDFGNYRVNEIVINSKFEDLYSNESINNYLQKYINEFFSYFDDTDLMFRLYSTSNVRNAIYYNTKINFKWIIAFFEGKQLHPSRYIVEKTSSTTLRKNFFNSSFNNVQERITDYKDEVVIKDNEIFTMHPSLLNVEDQN